MKIKITKQSLIDWSISLDGKIIGHITKNYLKENSGPYTFRVKALGYHEGRRFSNMDYTWEVVRSFREAKNLIIAFKFMEVE
jgi:hypothetical protein